MSSRVPISDPTIRFCPVMEPRREDRGVLRDRRQDHQRPVRPQPRDALLEEPGGDPGEEDDVGAAHLRQRPADLLLLRVDDVVGSERAGELRLPRSPRDGDHVGAHRRRHPDAEVPQTPDPGHRDGLPGKVPRAPQRGEHRDPRAEQGGRLHQVQPFGDLVDERLRRGNVLGVAAVHRHPGAPLGRAQHLRPGLARCAPPAGVLHPRHPRAVPRGERGHAFADLFDDAGHLVAGDDRKGGSPRRPVPVDQVKVAVADPAPVDPDQKLPGPRGGGRHFPDRERFPEDVTHGGFHPFAPFPCGIPLVSFHARVSAASAEPVRHRSRSSGSSSSIRCLGRSTSSY